MSNVITRTAVAATAVLLAAFALASPAGAQTNTAPIAVADSITLAPGQSAAIRVQDNDFDVEGDAFIVVSVTQPRHGTVSQSAQDGTPIYTPAPGYIGDDAFTYTLNGGSSALVSIAILPSGSALLCEHIAYGGVCEAFAGDDADLGDNAISNDRTSSLRTGGQTVALFEHTNFGGRCQLANADIVLLWGTHIGNDTVSSIRVGAGATCEAPRPPPPPGGPAPAQLCEHVDFGGVCEEFSGEDANLHDNAIGNDRASSVRVGGFQGRFPGQPVALYEHTNFLGRCETVFFDARSLIGSEVGNDTVSSIRVGRACEPAPPPAPVELCEDILYGGVCEGFTADDPDLGDNAIGNDRVSSVRAAGRTLALYEHTNFAGACYTVAADTAWLFFAPVANDVASSVRVGRGC